MSKYTKLLKDICIVLTVAPRIACAFTLIIWTTVMKTVAEVIALTNIQIRITMTPILTSHAKFFKVFAAIVVLLAF